MFRLLSGWDSAAEVGSFTESVAERFLQCRERGLRTCLRNRWHFRKSRYKGKRHCQGDLRLQYHFFNHGYHLYNKMFCVAGYRGSICSKRRPCPPSSHRASEDGWRARIQRHGRQRTEFADLHFENHSRGRGRPPGWFEAGRSAVICQRRGRFSCCFTTFIFSPTEKIHFWFCFVCRVSKGSTTKGPWNCWRLPSERSNSSFATLPKFSKKWKWGLINNGLPVDVKIIVKIYPRLKRPFINVFIQGLIFQGIFKNAWKFYIWFIYEVHALLIYWNVHV